MALLALFPDQRTGPAGLRYQPEFVSEAAESELIAPLAESGPLRFESTFPARSRGQAGRHGCRVSG